MSNKSEREITESRIRTLQYMEKDISEKMNTLSASLEAYQHLCGQVYDSVSGGVDVFKATGTKDDFYDYINGLLKDKFDYVSLATTIFIANKLIASGWVKISDFEQFCIEHADWIACTPNPESKL